MKEKWEKVNNLIKGTLTIRDPNTGKIIKEIDIKPNDTLMYKREEIQDLSYRIRLDRKKSGLFHKQVHDDMMKIVEQTSINNGTKFPKGKYLTWMKSIEPNPKTLQRRGGQSEQRKAYKETLEEYFKKSEKELEKFKDKKLLVYLCFYLRKERFETSDVDNYVKWFIDTFKEYIGDDKQVETLIAEKKQLYDDYSKEDLDFLETTIVYITEHSAIEDILTI